ncbi:hypothetical protein Avbf_12031 [Armadillidium vulgare]|nr:hypothetical protein Avbf_12031 [Armadillidium vulgare]
MQLNNRIVKNIRINGEIQRKFSTENTGVRDATSSYTYALWMLGGCEFAAFCLWLLMPCAEKFDENKYSKNQRKQKLKII